MVIKTHSKFDKLYKKRISFDSSLKKRFTERVKLFKIDQRHPLLDDHQLKGEKKQYRSFSIAGDLRVIYYQISDEEVLFVDIGSHNQVY